MKFRMVVNNFEDFILIASILEDGSQYPLIEKGSGVVYLSRRQPFKELRDLKRLNSLIHIKGNQMTILFLTHPLDEVEDELQYYTQESNVTKERRTWYWWAAIALIIFSSPLQFDRIFEGQKVQLSWIVLRDSMITPVGLSILMSWTRFLELMKLLLTRRENSEGFFDSRIEPTISQSQFGQGAYTTREESKR